MSAATLLVTGGSTGIGAACVRLAAKHGYTRVVLTYANDAAAAQATAEAAGIEAHALRSDVTDPAATADLFAQLAQIAPGPLHLVNNAGIVSPTGSIADLTPERVAHVFRVNVLGAIEVARQAVAFMRAHGGGHIVNVSSAAARLGSPNQYIDYAATKGAIETFTTGLAQELAPEGIRVNALRPGIIETPIHGKGGEPDRAGRLGPMVPMRRAGSAEEVAEGLLWLLSDAASYVTGTVIDVTGGR